MLTIAESDARFLVVPEDAAEVDGLPADVTVLRQPVEPLPHFIDTALGRHPGLDKVAAKKEQATQLHNDALKMLDRIIKEQWLQVHGVAVIENLLGFAQGDQDGAQVLQQSEVMVDVGVGHGVIL